VTLCWACALDVRPTIRVRPYGTVAHGSCCGCRGAREDDGSGRTQLICEVHPDSVGVATAFFASHRTAGRP
jgi:hypothetical protein